MTAADRCRTMLTIQAFRLNLVVIALAVAPAAWAQVDLSLLSDFGRADIPQARLGLSPGIGNTAGIEQQGNRNKALIDQSFGAGNNAEVWQMGSGSTAEVTQTGSNNELRLIQDGDNHSASLIQIGSANQMAIQQLGMNDSVTGLQQGTGNQFVMQQSGNNIQFQFSQVGDGNQMVANLPSGVSMRVDQVGNGLAATIAPSP